MTFEIIEDSDSRKGDIGCLAYYRAIPVHLNNSNGLLPLLPPHYGLLDNRQRHTSMLADKTKMYFFL